MTTESAPSNEIHVPPELGERLIQGEITLGELVGLSPSALYAIANLGYQLLNTGKLDQALTIYQGLVAVSPYDSVFHCHLAATLYALGQYEEALHEYTQALNFNKANVDALAGRGELYLRAGQLLEAINDLKHSIELDPEGKRPSTLRARATLVMLKEAAERQSSGQAESSSMLPPQPEAAAPKAPAKKAEKAESKPAAKQSSGGKSKSSGSSKKPSKK